MGTYAIGDIHGCYTQFTELRERIEQKDPDAVFILVGDIVYRGHEEEKMLDWAYRNVTPDGKYQMVLGNHDDAFIEVFGDHKFDTIYSLGGYTVSDNYEHLKADTDLKREYAAFLAGLPLMKAIEANGRKYIIAHAWYCPEKSQEAEMDKNEAFDRRFCLLWKRDVEEDGEIVDSYKPENGEKLIHGHTPSIYRKDAIHRGYSPGKVWDMGTSINIDCGLVFNVTKSRAPGAEYGNLAAYSLETGEIEYLWDIPDGYAENGDEYYEDKRERIAEEQRQRERKRQEAVQRTMPYQLSFYKQVFKTDNVPADKNYYNRVSFNFLNDYFGADVRMDHKLSDDYDFDFERDTVLAYTRDSKKETLYVYDNDKWYGIDLADDFVYKVFIYKNRYYALGVNHYNSEFAEVTITDFFNNSQILIYKAAAPWFTYSEADSLLDGDIKIGKRKRYYWYKDEDEEEPLGLITCDFYDRNELFTVKMLRNPGDAFLVRVIDSKKNTVTEIRQVYR